MKTFLRTFGLALLGLTAFGLTFYPTFAQDAVLIYGASSGVPQAIKTDGSGNMQVKCISGCGAGSLAGQITWNSGLGNITHILGPTDQALNINAATSRALQLTGPSNISFTTNTLKWTITTGLFSVNAIGGDKGNDTVNMITGGLYFDGLARIYNIASSDFSTASATLVTATGLSWTMPASKAVSVPFRCVINYSQATAAAANLFGLITGGTAPTSIQASGLVSTSATAHTEGTATITTATSTTVVTATPSAITTVWRAVLEGFIEAPSNASPTTVAVGVATGNVSDTLTIKRGSFCIVN